MRIGEAEKWIRESLKEIYDSNESAIIASLLLEECTGLPKTELVLKREYEIPISRNRLTDHIQRLLLHEPIQYIQNKAPFYGLELYVDKNVLIPRPETEELVDWVVKDIRAQGLEVFTKAATDADATKQLKILDVGTGSGCIALALKKTMPKAEVWGCDLSEEALNVARRNGSDLNLRVDFQGIDFLDEAQQRSLPTVDIIISNPPYIPAQEKGEMNTNVVGYEPHTALFVPDTDPLLFYKAIVGFAKKRLYATGAIYAEIHEAAGKAVIELFQQAGYKTVELKKDMQEKDRMIKAVL